MIPHTLPRLIWPTACLITAFLPTLAADAAAPTDASASTVTAAATATRPDADNYRRLASEVEGVLKKDVLEKFFPAADDEQGGGFFENFSANWTRSPNNATRSIVYQSRLTWLAAQAAVFDPAQADKYKVLSSHGVAELANLQWDKTNGGFFWSVNVSGAPTNQQKHAYGNAFAIYAAAVNYSVTHESASLDLAKQGFAWLEAHSHDAKNGGYIEAMNVDGTPMVVTPPAPLPPTTAPTLPPVPPGTVAASGTAPTAPGAFGAPGFGPGGRRGGGRRGGGNANDAIGTPIGQKSMNSHIHILEGLTALLEIWPDPVVKQRVQEVYELSLNQIYSDPGYLNMFFNADWSVIAPRNGGDSYGHNIEAAYLLTDTAKVLGKPDDPTVWAAARKLVDHALEKGWDKENGGFYEEGNLNTPGYTKQNKCWWVEAEGLYALLLIHERYGKETTKYWDAFVQQWKFISEHQLDPVNGGWYSYVTPDGSSPTGQAMNSKTDQWTEGYHQGRALLNTSALLRKLASTRP